MRRFLVFIFLFLLLLPSTANAVEPLDLSWNLSEEKRSKEKKEYVISTTQEGWSILTKEDNWITYQGFKLPSSARYLTNFTVETEVNSTRPNGKYGVFIANEQIGIVFCIESNETVLRIGGGEKVSKVSSGKNVEPVFPSKVKIKFDIVDNTIQCYYNEQEVINKKFSDIPKMPNISTIQIVGVVGGTNYGTRNSEYIFKTINLKAN